MNQRHPIDEMWDTLCDVFGMGPMPELPLVVGTPEEVADWLER